MFEGQYIAEKCNNKPVYGMLSALEKDSTSVKALMVDNRLTCNTTEMIKAFAYQYQSVNRW